MTRKTIKIMASVVAASCLIWGLEEYFRRRVGSFTSVHPFAKSWEFRATESQVFAAIKELTRNCDRPTDSIVTPTAHSNDYSIRGHYINFYYPATGEVVQTWLQRGQDSTKASLALISIRKLNDPKHSRLINRDFGYLENRNHLRRFEKEIIDRLQEILQRRKKKSLN